MADGMYCGIGSIPKNKRRGTAEYCIKNNQVRYYGIKRVDPELVETLKKVSRSSLTKEILKLRKIQDEVKILVSEYRKAKIIQEHKDSTPAEVKRAAKKIQKIVEKKNLLKKNLAKQLKLVDNLEKEEKRLEKELKKSQKKKRETKTKTKRRKTRAGSKR